MYVNFSLNFVWIQATRLPIPQTDAEITNPIPEKLMDNVVEVAENYSDMPIRIWADIYGIGEQPEPIMRKLNNNDLPSNIIFRSLDEIQKYRIDPLYKLPFDGFERTHNVIWRQVDMARLHVLEHCIIEDNMSMAIYSDMDIELISPSFAKRACGKNPLDEAKRILQKEGFFIGIGEEGIENQVIGISPIHYGFLRNHLIPHTAHYIDQGYNGWRGLLELVIDGKVTGLRRGSEEVNTTDVACEVFGLPNERQIKESYQGLRLY